MDDYDWKVFDERAAPDAYTAEIVPTRPTHSIQEFQDLVRFAFDHIRCVYPPVPEKEIKTTTNLSYLFYKECYCHENVKITRDSDPGRKNSIDDFLDAIINVDETPRNRFIFLTGDVGCGKTALINYILSIKMPWFVDQNRVWFLRFDLEHEGGRDTMLNQYIFIAKLAAKAYKVVQKRYKDFPEIIKCAEKLAAAALALECAHHEIGARSGKNVHHENLRQMNNNNEEECLALGYAEQARARINCVDAFRDLVALIKVTTGRRLLLFIDNVDYVMYLHARTFFCDGNGDADHTKISIQDFEQFIRTFYSNGIFTELHASIIITVRTDTFKLLQDIWSNTWSVSIKGLQPTQHFKVEEYEGQESDVINSRFDLVDIGIPLFDQEGKRDEFKRLQQIIKDNALSGDPTLISRLLKLSTCRYRDVVEFLSTYSFLGPVVAADERLVKVSHQGRLLHNVPVAMLAFILKRRAYFSQRGSKFPNLYLVRMIPNTYEMEYDHKRLYQHPHSYWLKALLLKAIQVKRNWKVEQIEACFAPAAGGGYNRSLVHACLGSFLEVNSSNLFSIKEVSDFRPGQYRIDEIALTRRAEYCMAVDSDEKRPDLKPTLFDHFYYLQLLMDEKELPIPKCVMHYFDYSYDVRERIADYFDGANDTIGDCPRGPDRIDYRYLVKPNPEDYTEGLKKMIHTKSRQVAVFIEILAEYFRIEQFMFSAAFDNIRENSIPLPDIQMLRKNFYSEIEALFLTLGIGLQSVLQIRQWATAEGVKIRKIFSAHYLTPQRPKIR